MSPSSQNTAVEAPQEGSHGGRPAGDDAVEHVGEEAEQQRRREHEAGDVEVRERDQGRRQGESQEAERECGAVAAPLRGSP